MRQILIAGGLFFSVLAPAQLDDTGSLLLTDKSAYMLMPPEVVSRGVVSKTAWSPNGKWILIYRMVPRGGGALLDALAGKAVEPEKVGQIELVAVNVKTKAEKRFLAGPVGSFTVGELEWLGASETAVVSLVRPGETAKHTVLLASPTTGGTTTLYEGDQAVRVSLSPVRSVGVAIHLDDHGVTQARAFDPSGWTGGAYPFEGNRLMGWTPDGNELLLVEARRGQPTPKASAVNPVSGATRALPGVPKATDRALLMVRNMRVPVARLVRGQAPCVVLEAMEAGKLGAYSTVVVTTDGESGALSPTGDAVAYISRGTAFIRPVLKVPGDVAREAIVSSLRARAMSDARQNALALIMYSADYSDTLPGPEGWQDKVAPYVRSRSLLDSFVYTFPGGLITNIKKPSETEIGYLPGPGGRAVAFADGHVKWIPDE